MNRCVRLFYLLRSFIGPIVKLNRLTLSQRFSIAAHNVDEPKGRGDGYYLAYAADTLSGWCQRVGL